MRSRETKRNVDMVDEMKYVKFVVTLKHKEMEMIVVFPEELTHSVVADNIRRAIKEEFGPVLGKVSNPNAGFFSWSPTPKVWGRSESLNVSSDEDDALLVWHTPSRYT